MLLHTPQRTCPDPDVRSSEGGTLLKGDDWPTLGLWVKGGENARAMSTGWGPPFPAMLSPGSAAGLAKAALGCHRGGQGAGTAHLEFRISSTCLGVKAKMHGLS